MCKRIAKTRRKQRHVAVTKATVIYERPGLPLVRPAWSLAITRERTTIRFSVIGMQTFKPITRRRGSNGRKEKESGPRDTREDTKGGKKGERGQPPMKGEGVG